MMAAAFGKPWMRMAAFSSARFIPSLHSAASNNSRNEIGERRTTIGGRERHAVAVPDVEKRGRSVTALHVGATAQRTIRAAGAGSGAAVVGRSEDVQTDCVDIPDGPRLYSLTPAEGLWVFHATEGSGDHGYFATRYQSFRRTRRYDRYGLLSVTTESYGEIVTSSTMQAT